MCDAYYYPSESCQAEYCKKGTDDNCYQDETDRTDGCYSSKKNMTRDCFSSQGEVSRNCYFSQNGTTQDCYISQNGTSQDCYISQNGLSRDCHFSQNGVSENCYGNTLDSSNEQQQTSLYDLETTSAEDESNKPHSRRRRQAFDLPERDNIGLDGMEEEEFI